MILYNKQVRKAQQGIKTSYVNKNTKEYDKAEAEGSFANKTNELSGIEIKASPKKIYDINSLYPKYPKSESVKKGMIDMLPSLHKLTKPYSCGTVNCSQYSTTEYANIMGVSRDIVSKDISEDAWYKRSKILSTGGENIWNGNGNIDSTKIRIGDFISLGDVNGGRSNKQPSLGAYSSSGLEQENLARHSGIVVGKDNRGVVVIRHNFNGVVFEEPIDNIVRTGMNYKPLSITRPKSSYQYLNKDNKILKKKLFNESLYKTYKDDIPYKMADGIDSGLYEKYRKNRRDISEMYQILPEELDNVFKDLLGISQQESNLNNTNATNGVGDWAKQALTDNMPSSMTKGYKQNRAEVNTLKDWFSSYKIDDSIPSWKRQIEIDKLTSQGIEKSKAQDLIFSKMGKNSGNTDISDKSKGPFKQKKPAERWLAINGNKEYSLIDSMYQSNWGKEWDDSDENYIKNAIGLYLDNKENVKKAYPNESAEFIRKATILSHNAPKKALAKEYTDFYIKGVGNNNVSKYNSSYISNVVQATNKITKDIVNNAMSMRSKGGILLYK